MAMGIKRILVCSVACDRYFPVRDPCQEVVGLPCGSNNYIDSKDYTAYGFLDSFSSGDLAVLNDLGGSMSGAGNDIVGALIALNRNGTIDTSKVINGTQNNSVFVWNPSE